MEYNIDGMTKATRAFGELCEKEDLTVSELAIVICNLMAVVVSSITDNSDEQEMGLEALKRDALNVIRHGECGGIVVTTEEAVN